VELNCHLSVRRDNYNRSRVCIVSVVELVHKKKVCKVSRKKILTFPEDYTVNADRYGRGILTLSLLAPTTVGARINP